MPGTPSNSPRPALLPIPHPLNYSTPEPIESRLHSLEARITYLYERHRIEDLLNTYGYLLDTVIMDPQKVEDWVDLFTHDCDLIYPFGSRHGKSGLAQWCLTAQTRFQRMLHMSSNLTVAFESAQVAHGRSTLLATCGLHDRDLGQCFSEGGYYYWSFRLVHGQWKISYLFLDVNWTSGDYLDLNTENHGAGSPI